MPSGKHLTHPLVEATLVEAVASTEFGIQVAAFLNDERLIDAFGGIANPKTGQLVETRCFFRFLLPRQLRSQFCIYRLNAAS